MGAKTRRLTPLEIITPEEMRQNYHEFFMEQEGNQPEYMDEYLYDQTEDFTVEMEAECFSYQESVHDGAAKIESDYSEEIEYRITMPRYIGTAFANWYSANKDVLQEEFGWFDVDQCVVGLMIDAIRQLEEKINNDAI